MDKISFSIKGEAPDLMDIHLLVLDGLFPLIFTASTSPLIISCLAISMSLFNPKLYVSLQMNNSKLDAIIITFGFGSH